MPPVTWKNGALTHIAEMLDIAGLILFAAVGGAVYYAVRSVWRFFETLLRKPWDRWRPPTW